MIRPDRFARPNIGISRCIELDHCRYNGDIIGSEFVRRLVPYVRLSPVCPEVEIGLGVPRDPIRVVLREGERHLVQPSTGRDLTGLMTSFSTSRLDGLRELDGFILKSRSPSCGIHDVRVYPDREGAAPINRQAGVFGGVVVKRLPHLAVEDEARLRNIKLGEHFLARAFTSASFREMAGDASIADLVDFHSRNKLLLMVYSQKELGAMGNIVANRSGAPLEAVLEEYRAHLWAAMARPPRCSSPVNVLMHALGYFSDRLKAEEKEFFLQNLRMYRDARIPLSVCLGLMRSYILRFGNDYLAAQTFFGPFPDGILEVGITDSCDWREVG